MELSEQLYYETLRIRLVEEKIIELYPSDLIQSPVHLSIGQEAVAVGVCNALKPDDWIFINYRGHAFYLAKGAPLDKFFAELMGKETGICGGKGGSMHLAAPKYGIMGASAVVGTTISHAVGAALAEKYKKSNRIFVTNFGDGATEQGAFHESLNMAALYEVPVLFLCEDNGLAVHSPKKERQAFNMKKFVDSYGIEYFKIEEGIDPESIFFQAKPVIQYIRKSGKPAFLHVKTMRYMEHVGPGEDFTAGYRSEKQITKWKSKDPIEYDKRLRNKYKKTIDEEINKAVTFAMNSNFPQKEMLLKDV